MKVNIFKETHLKENYIDLHYEIKDNETEVVLKFLDTFQIPILGKLPEEEKERLILPGEILYLEIVERKCFLYLKDSVWKADATIQGFLDKYESQGFVRVSKSMAVNIHYVRELKAELNMRINIVLDNEEIVVLNRNYRNEFLTYLKQLRREEK